jgi:hypothetical protein
MKDVYTNLIKQFNTMLPAYVKLKGFRAPPLHPVQQMNIAESTGWGVHFCY